MPVVRSPSRRDAIARNRHLGLSQVPWACDGHRRPTSDDRSGLDERAVVEGRRGAGASGCVLSVVPASNGRGLRRGSNARCLQDMSVGLVRRRGIQKAPVLPQRGERTLPQAALERLAQQEAVIIARDYNRRYPGQMTVAEALPLVPGLAGLPLEAEQRGLARYPVASCSSSETTSRITSALPRSRGYSSPAGWLGTRCTRFSTQAPTRP